MPPGVDRQGTMRWTLGDRPTGGGRDHNNRLPAGAPVRAHGLPVGAGVRWSTDAANHRESSARFQNRSVF